MENRKILYCLTLVLSYIFSSCSQKDDTSNRSYFTFDPEDRKVVIPTQLNDSINVKLMFDTGDGPGCNLMLITLDTTILSAHPVLSSNSIPTTDTKGNGWNKNYIVQSLVYSSNQKLKIGNTDFIYATISVTNLKKQMNSNVSDGVFNIPRNDTTHIWELNFKNNYMEIHSANDFTMPKDCFITPLVGPDGCPFFIDLPLQIKFMDNDTLTINQRFLLDTGVAWDIVLLYKAPELEFLNKREDAVWLKSQGSYIRHYTVNAALLDSFTMDSLRIYTIDYKNNIGFTNYVIGLNFLKRFNVFFDMKNKQLGLQPINNFERLVNPLYTRFYYSTQKTKDGKFIINRVGNYKENVYKTAGLQIGDEIVAMNNVPYGEITTEIAEEFKKQDIITVEIIRNGKPLSLTVKIAPHEPMGD